MFENKAYASFSSEGFTSFYYKKKSDELWNKFSGSKKEFIQQISDEFGHLPEVRKKISLKKYKKKDLESTINTYKYYASMKSGTPIYFDKYWNETYSAKKSHYKAIVESKSDSLYKVIYYKNSIKLYEAFYTSFMPNIRQSKFISFYSSGSIREMVEFKNDSLLSKKVYNKNEELIRSYSYDYYTTSKGEMIAEKYVPIDGSIPSIFEYKNVTYNQKHKNQEIISSYFTKNDSTIYQFCEYPGEFDYKKLSSKFEYWKRFNKFSEYLKENAEGIIFVSFIINKNGNASSYKILNKLHPELDSIMVKFCDYIGPNHSTPYYFGTYEVNDEKVDYEVIIPFEFMINREYRKPFRYPFLLNKPYHMQLYRLEFNGVNMMGPMITPVPY